MANSAPFMARPFNRVTAGFVDLFISICLLGLVVHFLDINKSMVIASVGLVVYGFYHALCYSSFNGVTLGLRYMDMRLVSASNRTLLSARQAVLRAVFRPALLFLTGWAALDYAPPGAWRASVFLTPIIVELGMMFTLPSRQTLSDLVSKTLVINVPPLQPHRAPAGPMYSASDAEFGFKHRK